MKKISEKWKFIATAWLGNEEGKHCHWCKFIIADDGEVECGNEKSKFCNSEKIRSWDGLECAEQCGLFELDEWYTNDENWIRYYGDSVG